MTPERWALLGDIAYAAVGSGAFPHLTPPDPDTPPESPAAFRARQRARLALLVADELGMSLTDALNRVRFTEAGITVAPATDSTFDESLRRAVGEAQKARPSEPTEPVASPALSVVMPRGYTPEGKRFGECSIGELAYFVEESEKKGGLDAERGAAWAALGLRLPDSTAFELGKLTRWILHKAHPERRKRFQDVLVVAEQRIEELGGAQ